MATCLHTEALHHQSVCLPFGQPQNLRESGSEKPRIFLDARRPGCKPLKYKAARQVIPGHLVFWARVHAFATPCFAFAGFVFFRNAFAALSRRTVTTHQHQHAGFRVSFAAGPSLVTFAISFRKLSRPAVLLSLGFYRTPACTTLYCQGLWRC